MERNGGAKATTLLDLPDHVIVESILPLLFPPSLSGESPKAKDLRDILSFASTCTRIHALASNPSLWRGVNAAVFCGRASSYGSRSFPSSSPPPLPLGAVNCGVFDARQSDALFVDIGLLESLPDLTAVVATLSRLSTEDRWRIGRAIASFPRLAKLELDGEGASQILTNARLPKSLAVLSICDPCGDLVQFFSANSFPSLVKLGISINSAASLSEYGNKTDVEVTAAVAGSCPSVSAVELRGCFTSPAVAGLAASCPSLRSLTVVPNDDLVGVDTVSSVTHVSGLVLDMFISGIGGHGRVSRGFLAMFPGLVSLRLTGNPFLTTDVVASVGRMPQLEHLEIDFGCQSPGSCAVVRSLVESPPMWTRPLQSLVLWGCGSDGLQELLTSQWCSRLSVLKLFGCGVSDECLDMVAAAQHDTLCSSLRVFAFSSGKRPGITGTALGRFVSELRSLRELLVFSQLSDFGGFSREIGSSRVRPVLIIANVPDDCNTSTVSQMMCIFASARSIELRGNVSQSTADMVASSCPVAARFVVPKGVVRPAQLLHTCEFIEG